MRTFSVWGGKYDFNLTACVSDADRMLLFRWHIPCIYILFFSRVLRRMATNINFISKWYLMWTSHTRMHVYSRGCTASFIFFHAKCLSLLSLISLRNSVVFWLFCLYNIDLANTFSMGFFDASLSFSISLTEILTCRINLTTSVCTRFPMKSSHVEAIGSQKAWQNDCYSHLHGNCTQHEQRNCMQKW